MTIKMDPQHIPYRTLLQRWMAPEKRLHHAVVRKDWLLAAALVGAGVGEVDYRLSPLERGGLNVGPYQDNGHTLLHVLILNQYYDAARQLLEKGADPNIATFFHETPMHWAAEKGDVDAVLLLMQYGGDIHAKKSRRGNFVDFLGTGEEIPNTIFQDLHTHTGQEYTEEDLQRMVLERNLTTELSVAKHQHRRSKI